MKESTTQVSDRLAIMSKVFSNLDQSAADELANRLQAAATTLRLFRDTLISIANCRRGSGIASHQAQAALIETGECAHFNSVYHHRGESGDESAWRCHDCNRESINRLGAFE